MKTIILVFGNLTFPPREGLHAQAVSLMRAMRERGYRISAIVSCRDMSLLDRAGLDLYVGGLVFLDVIPSRLNYPLLMLRNAFGFIHPGDLHRQLLIRARQHPDAILHFDGIAIAPLLRFFRKRSVLMSAVDPWSRRQDRLADSSSGLKRWLLRAYARVTEFIERQSFPHAALVQLVSDEDADWLRTRFPGLPVVHIPLAMPEELEIAHHPHRALSPHTGIKLLFWGDLSVRHIKQGLDWFSDEIAPRLRARGLQFAITVLGRRKAQPLELQKLPEAEFLDWVESVEDVVYDADIVVLPDQSGTGVKNRTVIAMALSRPVVGTSFAFEGTGVSDQVSGFRVNDPQEFADCITRLALDVELRTRVGLSAAKHAEDTFSPEAIYILWAHAYESLGGPERPSESRGGPLRPIEEN